MTDQSAKPRRMKTAKTQSLSANETAWFQVASHAGTFLDNLQDGQITEQNREDLLGLYRAIQGLVAAEGLEG